MAKNTIAYYTKAGRTNSATVNSSGSAVTVFTAGTDGSKILAINLTSYTFGSTGFINLIVNDGSDNIIFAISSDDLVSKDLLSYINLPKTSSGDKYINIEATTTIKIDLTGGTGSIGVSVYGEDY